MSDLHSDPQTYLQSKSGAPWLSKYPTLTKHVSKMDEEDGVWVVSCLVLLLFFCKRDTAEGTCLNTSLLAAWHVVSDTHTDTEIADNSEWSWRLWAWVNRKFTSTHTLLLDKHTVTSDLCRWIFCPPKSIYLPQKQSDLLRLTNFIISWQGRIYPEIALLYPPLPVSLSVTAHLNVTSQQLCSAVMQHKAVPVLSWSGRGGGVRIGRRVITVTGLT